MSEEPNAYKCESLQISVRQETVDPVLQGRKRVLRIAVDVYTRTDDHLYSWPINEEVIIMFGPHAFRATLYDVHQDVNSFIATLKLKKILKVDELEAFMVPIHEEDKG